LIAIALGVVTGGVLHLILENLVITLCGGLTAMTVPILYVLYRRKKRLDTLRSQLPDALELMSRVMRAGQTITQAMHAVSDEFKPPVASEFGFCYEQQNLGLAPDIALRDLAKRTGLLEIKIFVLALLVHRQSGGNLAELLDKLSDIIRERYKILGKIRALTAEGRLQAAILLGLPPFMYVVLLIISRAYALQLLDHPRLIIGAIIAMIFGALWIRKIVNFDF
jgi:tight adherence protein B